MNKELQRIEELEKEIQKLKELQGLNSDSIPTYSFSKITDKKLRNIVDIEKSFNRDIFNDWFNFKYKITVEDTEFFLKLIDKFRDFIEDYKEEDLKIYYISQILNRVDFILVKDRYSGLYNEPLRYETDKFILNGEVDFVFAKGLTEAIKPYFFIQEFKRAEEFSNPRPQLLAELIAGVELNNEKIIKGAYIIGIHWYFVILEKKDKNTYQYFVSESFNSTKIDDLKMIYKNLLFVKDEVLKIINKN